MADVDITGGVSRAGLPTVLRASARAFERSRHAILCIRHGASAEPGVVAYANPALYAWLREQHGTERVDGLSIELDDAEVCDPGSGRNEVEGLAWLVAADGSRSRCMAQIVTCQDEQGDYTIAHLERPELGAPALARDVTEDPRQYAQSFESQKMEALGRLAGSVAHDFNNMLSAIQGFARFIHDDLPPESGMREDAAQILRASARAAALTQQLLAFGRRQVLEPRVVDVREQIGDMEKMLRQLLPEHVHLRISGASEIDRIRVDPVKLEQVVMNLILNAREAMPRGGTITLEIDNVALESSYARPYLDLRPGRYVLLTVADTGVGMTEAVRGRIFEPFFTTKGEGRGTGLGLATVFGIVKQSGGHVDVYSELGRGSVFKVYFPSCSELPEREELPGPVSEAVAVAETVLVVEDEASVRELVERILLRSGFRVLTAASPQQAMALDEAHLGPLHMLLTDVVMPGMSGHDLAMKLRQRRPGLVTVYMSGHADNTVQDQGVRLDEQGFVPKPIDPTLLLSRLRAARSLQDHRTPALRLVVA